MQLRMTLLPAKKMSRFNDYPTLSTIIVKVWLEWDGIILWHITLTRSPCKGQQNNATQQMGHMTYDKR